MAFLNGDLQEIRKAKMQQSGGLLLTPVQTLVATFIFAFGKNANESQGGSQSVSRRFEKSNATRMSVAADGGAPRSES